MRTSFCSRRAKIKTKGFLPSLNALGVLETQSRAHGGSALSVGIGGELQWWDVDVWIRACAFRGCLGGMCSGHLQWSKYFSGRKCSTAFNTTPGVLVFYCHHEKLPQTWQLQRTFIYHDTVLEVRSPAGLVGTRLSISQGQSLGLDSYLEAPGLTWALSWRISFWAFFWGGGRFWQSWQSPFLTCGPQVDLSSSESLWVESFSHLESLWLPLLFSRDHVITLGPPG